MPPLAILLYAIVTFLALLGIWHLIYSFLRILRTYKTPSVITQPENYKMVHAELFIVVTNENSDSVMDDLHKNYTIFKSTTHDVYALKDLIKIEGGNDNGTT